MAVNISSFLTEGAQIPTGSALVAKQSETVLPQWYTNYAQQLLANQNAVSSLPDQTYQGPRVAAFAPAQQQGFAMTMPAATAYQPGLAAATRETQGALAAPGGMAAAQPYLGQASQSSVANIGQYMNPFTEQVVNRLGELGARNLSENLMPAITSKFINAGQLGFGPRGGGGTPSGMMTDTARALRDTQEATLAEQNKALQAGYGQAAELASGDLARQAGLATAAGGLAGADITRRLAGAEQLGGLAQTAQSLGLTGAQAVGNVGMQQQAQAQKNLDVAYGDFLRQQGYNQEQINNAMATLKGTAGAVPTGSQEYGIQPTNQPAEYKPSTAATIGGALSGLGSILSLIK